MRVGIFGGTFNPAHNGHRRALEAFIQAAALERVYVIPTYLPPHKEKADKWADFDDRLAMCSLAFSDIDTECELIFSDIEKKLFEKSGEKSYTHLTVRALLEKGEENLFLFVGTDMFLTLHLWKKTEYILENAEIFVMARGDENDGEIEECKKRLETNFKPKKITVIDSEALAASSTEVRSGAFLLISDKVKKYITERGLYVQS